MILTVSQINTYISSVLDYDENLKNIYVTGEISNYRPNYSGHLYFDLKDADSIISAVMWKSSASKIKFKPENGMKVLVRGSISSYAKGGRYNLSCDDIQPDGIGALQIAFEQTKKQLEKEGLFSSEHKKAIPQMPLKIGVATAKNGAAIKDIFSILQRRFPLAEIVFVPVAVQGIYAAPEIAKAIKTFNEQTDCEVLIIGRGGGSAEDLWAFNEEIVARAIYDSKIPVISAVGHETDFTIADFVADLRAATPSAAAELCSVKWEDVLYTIDSLLEDTENKLLSRINQTELQINELTERIEFFSPLNMIERESFTVDSVFDSITKKFDKLIEKISGELSLINAKIDSNSPLKILEKGYTIARKNGNLISKVNELNKGDSIELQLSDGTVNCIVD